MFRCLNEFWSFLTAKRAVNGYNDQGKQANRQSRRGESGGNTRAF